MLEGEGGMPVLCYCLSLGEDEEVEEENEHEEEMEVVKREGLAEISWGNEGKMLYLVS